MKKTFAIFCLALGASLFSCAESEGSSNPAVSVPAGLAAKLAASWKADTSINVNSGIMSIPVAVVFNVTISANQTFTGTITDSILGTAITGSMFTESGTWVAKSVDTVVLRPAACSMADTATTTIMGATLSLPFRQTASGFAANALKPIACPDSVVITKAPVNDTLRLSMPVNVPLQGKSVWSLAFKKQP